MKPIIRKSPHHISEEDDEEDPYAYDEKEAANEVDEDDEDSDEGDAEVDLDVLPTLLVYRDGELENTWVRVDWEAGAAGIDDLLHR